VSLAGHHALATNMLSSGIYNNARLLPCTTMMVSAAGSGTLGCSQQRQHPACLALPPTTLKNMIFPANP